QLAAAVIQGLYVSAGIDLLRERAGSTFITGASGQQMPIERFAAGYFAEGRWNSNERLFLTAGLRVDDIRRDRLEESFGRPVLPKDTVVSVNPRVAGGGVGHARGGGPE